MYEYQVTQPMLPPPEHRTNTGPMMDYREMTWWMNDMSRRGWDFVGHATTTWSSGAIQNWWVFRRPIQIAKEARQNDESESNNHN